MRLPADCARAWHPQVDLLIHDAPSCRQPGSTEGGVLAAEVQMEAGWVETRARLTLGEDAAAATVAKQVRPAVHAALQKIQIILFRHYTCTLEARATQRCERRRRCTVCRTCSGATNVLT